MLSGCANRVFSGSKKSSDSLLLSNLFQRQTFMFGIQGSRCRTGAEQHLCPVIDYDSRDRSPRNTHQLCSSRKFSQRLLSGRCTWFRRCLRWRCSATRRRWCACTRASCTSSPSCSTFSPSSSLIPSTSHSSSSIGSPRSGVFQRVIYNQS